MPNHRYIRSSASKCINQGIYRIARGEHRDSRLPVGEVFVKVRSALVASLVDGQVKAGFGRPPSRPRLCARKGHIRTDTRTRLTRGNLCGSIFRPRILILVMSG